MVKCIICGQEAEKFVPFGLKPRPAKCPHCGSLERHRLVWQMLRHYSLPSPSRTQIQLLHFAPEQCLSTHLRERLGDGYLSVDLTPGAAMRVMDITRLELPDASVDGILCSHVLEHIPDDRRAMAEMRRVLRPDGWAIVIVPLRGERTLEEAEASQNPAFSREKDFGQADHVRFYGRDVVERLSQAGFLVETFNAVDRFGKDELAYFGLKNEPAFLCRPSSTDSPSE